MIKQHKKMLILTSVITLLPIFIGLLLWRQLPASVATHFGVTINQMGIVLKHLQSLDFR